MLIRKQGSLSRLYGACVLIGGTMSGLGGGCCAHSCVPDMHQSTRTFLKSLREETTCGELPLSTCVLSRLLRTGWEHLVHFRSSD